MGWPYRPILLRTGTDALVWKLYKFMIRVSYLFYFLLESLALLRNLPVPFLEPGNDHPHPSVYTTIIQNPKKFSDKIELKIGQIQFSIQFSIFNFQFLIFFSFKNWFMVTLTLLGENRARTDENRQDIVITSKQRPSMDHLMDCYVVYLKMVISRQPERAWSWNLACVFWTLVQITKCCFVQ